MPDYATLEDSGDWYGKLFAPRRHDRGRPEGCNGAARKIETRDGAIWWQPPADVVKDAVALASLEKRVRGYFRDDWSYVGVIVEVRTPACKECGERKTYSASLWGIESDSGDYFAEVLADLSHEAYNQPKGD